MLGTPVFFFSPNQTVWRSLPGSWTTVHSEVMDHESFWTTLSDLAFPRWCVGCGRWDEHLCPVCLASLSGPWRRVDQRAPHLALVRPTDAGREGLLRPGDAVSAFPVHALGDYDGVARRVVVAWKNSVNAGLTEALVDMVSARAVHIELGGGPVAVIPAPSRFRRRHDGRFVAGHLARAVARGINEVHSGGGRDRPVLAVRRDVLTTSTMSRLGRFMEREGPGTLLEQRGAKGRRVRLRGSVAERRAILVDDVLTSGATLAGCARALGEEGTVVVGAFVLAAARDPRASVARQAGSELEDR